MSEYTLKDAVETFEGNENIDTVEIIINGRDISDTIEELDMKKDKYLFVKCEKFFTKVVDLDFYPINVIDNEDTYGFEFSPNKREYYKFLYKR